VITVKAESATALTKKITVTLKAHSSIELSSPEDEIRYYQNASVRINATATGRTVTLEATGDNPNGNT
jgi:hypothetical protein